MVAGLLQILAAGANTIPGIGPFFSEVLTIGAAIVQLIARGTLG
ncbi:MAG TPA: hypothetical protein VNA32_08985 [Actinomycetota bacterium]|nr:hypothetical protein [Actinomycetota bacterium]